MGIIGVSQGLSDAQTKALSPLKSVGTDIIVTRTVAPTLSTATTTTTTPTGGFGGGGGFTGGGGFSGGGGGGFFGRGGAGLNATDAAALAAANSSVITDLAKLGPAGTKFTHDFFVPGTLITFPAQAVADVAKVKGVTGAVGALSLDALHESGTVPQGDGLGQDWRRDDLGDREAAHAHGGPAVRRTHVHRGNHHQAVGVHVDHRPGHRHRLRLRLGSGQLGRWRWRRIALWCGRGVGVHQVPHPGPEGLRAERRRPRETITQVLNPPTTIQITSTYTVAGVDPAPHRRVSSPTRSL